MKIDFKDIDIKIEADNLIQLSLLEPMLEKLREITACSYSVSDEWDVLVHIIFHKRPSKGNFYYEVEFVKIHHVKGFIYTFKADFCFVSVTWSELMSFVIKGINQLYINQMNGSLFSKTMIQNEH